MDNDDVNENNPEEFLDEWSAFLQKRKSLKECRIKAVRNLVKAGHFARIRNNLNSGLIVISQIYRANYQSNLILFSILIEKYFIIGLQYDI